MEKRICTLSGFALHEYSEPTYWVNFSVTPKSQSYLGYHWTGTGFEDLSLWPQLQSDMVYVRPCTALAARTEQ